MIALHRRADLFVESGTLAPMLMSSVARGFSTAFGDLAEPSAPRMVFGDRPNAGPDGTRTQAAGDAIVALGESAASEFFRPHPSSRDDALRLTIHYTHYVHCRDSDVAYDLDTALRAAQSKAATLRHAE
jgi:hypothetical protein